MPGAPIPDSAGRPDPENAGFLPSGKPGGEIGISRAEAAALTAFEAEDDHRKALSRARRESGLTDDQLRRLHSRAESLRSKGYTLRGGRALFRPKNFERDDETSLLGKDEVAGKKLVKKPAKKGTTREAAGRPVDTRKALSSLSSALSCAPASARAKILEAGKAVLRAHRGSVPAG